MTADMWAAIAAVALVVGTWFVLAFLDASRRIDDLVANVRDTRPQPPISVTTPGQAGEVITAVTDRLAEVLIGPIGCFQPPVDLSDVALLVHARKTAEELSSR